MENPVISLSFLTSLQQVSITEKQDKQQNKNFNKRARESE